MTNGDAKITIVHKVPPTAAAKKPAPIKKHVFTNVLFSFTLIYNVNKQYITKAKAPRNFFPGA
jgi:hypothetical protein